MCIRLKVCNVESHPVSIYPAGFPFSQLVTWHSVAVSIGSSDPLMANMIVMLKVFYMSSYHDSNDKANIKLEIELLM